MEKNVGLKNYQHTHVLCLCLADCGLWQHYSSFLHIVTNMYHNSLISRHKIFYQLIFMCEQLVSCVLPLCVIAFCYILTSHHPVESSSSLSEETQNPQLNTHKNSAQFQLCLTVVFLSRYVGYHTFWIHIIFTEDQKLSETTIITIIAPNNYNLQYTHPVSTYLFIINCYLNTVTLFGCTVDFRRQKLKCKNCHYFLHLNVDYILCTNFDI